MKMNRLLATILSLLLVAATTANAEQDLPFNIEPVTSFDEPWAMAFLPDGRLLVTEKKGNLFIVTQEGQKSRPVGSVPDVAYGGQGGLGDVALHPDFADNGLIYLSYPSPSAAATCLIPRSSGGSTRRSSAAATMDIVCYLTIKAISGSRQAIARSLRRRRTCNRLSARSCA